MIPRNRAFAGLVSFRVLMGIAMALEVFCVVQHYAGVLVLPR